MFFRITLKVNMFATKKIKNNIVYETSKFSIESIITLQAWLPPGNTKIS